MAARSFSSLLDPSRINLSVREPRQTAAIDEVAGLLEDHPAVTNYAGFHEALLLRERLDPTCLSNEIAMPHARTEHVSAIVLAVGRSEGGVFFDENNPQVRLLFVLGTPESDPGEYLRVISSLCRLLKEPSLYDALLHAPTPAAFIAAVIAAEQK